MFEAVTQTGECLSLCFHPESEWKESVLISPEALIFISYYLKHVELSYLQSCLLIQEPTGASGHAAEEIMRN